MEETQRAEVMALHARLCQALADPKRLLLIYELNDGPRSVGDLCATLGIPQSNVSQHLSILRDRGIVTASRSGARIEYRLRGEKVVQALDLLREFMREQATAALLH
ncbi:MAG TPA: metalloregulator ArsR/SmtB family transcription factor [Acidimicrobiales bacterium]|nr:metalloregulator ArsR/SmtB family transcription factor [Acidimicrobiales bacterium]